MSEKNQYRIARKQITEILITGGGGATRVSLSKFPGYENCDAGSLTIAGDFGPWNQIWSSIGAGTFGQFLASLERQYAMEKLGGKDIYELDAVNTQHEVRRHIAVSRRDGGLSRSEAREFFTLTEGMEIACTASEVYGGEREALLYELFQGDPILVNRMRGDVVFFWDQIWPLIVAEVLAIEDEEKAG